MHLPSSSDSSSEHGDIVAGRLPKVFLVRLLELPLVVFTAEVSVGRSWNFPSIICDGFPTDFAQQFHCCLLLYDEIPLTKRATT